MRLGRFEYSSRQFNTIQNFLQYINQNMTDQQHREPVIETANLPAVSPSPLLSPFSILIAPQEELSGNPFVSQTSGERPRTMTKTLKANVISSIVTFFPFSFSESPLHTFTCINVFFLIFFFFSRYPSQPTILSKTGLRLDF